MTRYDKFVEKAIEISQKSHMKHKLGALIIKSGKIVGTGFNISDRCKILKYKDISIHAEISAICSYLRKKNIFSLRADMSDVQLLVVRYSNEKCGESKPCLNCLRVIKSLKIKKIHYVNENGVLATSSPKNISSQNTKSFKRLYC
jgi:deoxycytidylate deaminase